MIEPPSHVLSHQAQGEAPGAEASPAADVKPIESDDSGFNIDPATLENIPWVMEGRYCRGYITALVGAPGAGKSLAVLADAAAVITGDALTGPDVSCPCNVWIHNSDDGQAMIRRRRSALAQIYPGLPMRAKRKLHVTTEENLRLGVIDEKTGGPDMIKIGKLKDFISRHEIKLFFIDPFVRIHFSDENDNTKIDKVLACIGQIAKDTDCAICLIHHTSKSATGMDESDQNQARGASAFTASARIVWNLFPVTHTVAESAGFRDGAWYTKLTLAKSNLPILSQCEWWYRKICLDLPAGGKDMAIQPVIKPNASLPSDLSALQALVFELMGNAPWMTTYNLAKLVFLSPKNPTNGAQKFTIQRKIRKLFDVNPPCTLNGVTLIHSSKPKSCLLRQSIKSSHSQ